MTETLVSTTGWTIKRHGKWIDGEEIEVFVAPDGKWYARVGAVGSKDAEPDVIIPMKRQSAPLRLVNIDHWRPAA